MPTILDDSFAQAFSAENRKVRDATCEFKTMRAGRLLTAIFSAVSVVVTSVTGAMVVVPHAGIGMFVLAFLGSGVAMAAVMLLVVVPKWCSEDEVLTFHADWVRSQLHGDVYCKDIVSYSAGGKSDRSVKIVTREKTIRYNFGPMSEYEHEQVSRQLSRMIDDFNASMRLAAEPDAPPKAAIREVSFFNGPVAPLMVAVCVIMALLLLIMPRGDVASVGLAIALFGGSMSLLAGIIRAKSRQGQ